MFVGIIILVGLLISGLLYYLSIPKPIEQKKSKVILPPVPKDIEPPSFVPSEARIVASKSSYSNKFNDVIGNYNSGIAPGASGMVEVVIPSDWYMFRTPPTEFDGDYWPRGSIEPDFIYPGGGRPLRSQNLYASQIVVCDQD